MLKQAIKPVSRISPKLWLGLRAWRRSIAGLDEKEISLLPYLVPRSKVAIDVGASSGVYTHQLLRLTDRVVAVEANPTKAENLRLLFGGKIQLIASALSNEKGTVDLHIPVDDGLATIDRGNPVLSKDHRTVCVPMTTLDDLQLKEVGFIKIDVEGHENQVLRGAEATISRDKPTLLMEIENRHRPNAVESMTRMAKEFGYSGYFLIDGALRPVSEFDATLHQSDEAISCIERGVYGSIPYYNNFVFLP